MGCPLNSLSLKLKTCLVCLFLGAASLQTGAGEVHFNQVEVKRENKEYITLFNKNWEKVLTFNNDLVSTFDLAIGDYYLLYKNKAAHSENTKYKSIKIIENQTTNILIEH